MGNYYILSDSDSKIYSDIKTKEEIFSPVKIKSFENSEIGIFNFGDEGLNHLKEAISSTDNLLNYFDKDGYVYYLDKNGTTKEEKWGNKYKLSYLKKSLRKRLRLTKYSAYFLRKDKKQTENFEKNIILGNGKALWYPSFRRLKFFNKSDDKCHRFRLHIPKESKNNALILFLHGAGAPGYDNFQQIWEVQKLYNRLKKAEKDCYILVPQLGYEDVYNTDEHSEMLWNLICEIDKK